ncbi:MAG: pantetheine-phosphate adenylyltransferase [Pseudobdellovibrionaceae bacterium]
MSKLAVYPGSFDPITLGHVDIIQRISHLYEEVVVLISKSPSKTSLFTAEERKELIEKSLSHLKNVKVDIHEGLTIDYMKKKKADVIVRGLRAFSDFEHELTMANMNKMLAPKIETLLIFSDPKYYFISSRGVKEVAQHGGSMQGLVTDVVMEALVSKMNK